MEFSWCSLSLILSSTCNLAIDNDNTLMIVTISLIVFFLSFMNVLFILSLFFYSAPELGRVPTFSLPLITSWSCLEGSAAPLLICMLTVIFCFRTLSMFDFFCYAHVCNQSVCSPDCHSSLFFFLQYACPWGEPKSVFFGQWVELADPYHSCIKTQSIMRMLNKSTVITMLHSHAPLSKFRFCMYLFLLGQIPCFCWLLNASGVVSLDFFLMPLWS